MTSFSARRHFLPVALSAALLWLAPRVARADGSLSYKYADYREADGRIKVETNGVLAEQDLGPDTQVKVQGIIDAIAGATPTGQPAPAGSDQVPLAEISDRRKAWSADLLHQFHQVNVDVGFADSRESDYTSVGWSVNTLTDFNRKNTTLLFGLAGTDDDVKVTYQKPWVKKRTNDLIVGVTQLLDPKTSLSVDLTWGHARGYLNDPYKEVQKTIQVNPGDFLPLDFLENRPGQRTKFIAAATFNHAFPEASGAIEAIYRYYHDTFDTNANTLEVSWLQRLGKQFLLKPTFRFYTQTAASFYYYNLDQTTITPPFGLPPADGPFYSSDYRLSHFDATTYGVKLVWTPTARVQCDVEYDRYEMRGRDGVTSQSAYPRAGIVTAGIRLSW
ncbi:MAG TPA: DUF3570 domain-containing protein [Candidatus Didemnitutus sp.]|nr:DUF3570 domain-containing protein [Candidatus Didemnitutus sp.]